MNIIPSDSKHLMTAYKEMCEAPSSNIHNFKAKEIYENACKLYDHGELHKAGKLFSFLTGNAYLLSRFLNWDEISDIQDKGLKTYHTLCQQLSQLDKRIGQFGQKALIDAKEPYHSPKAYVHYLTLYRDMRKKNENNKCIKEILHPMHRKCQKNDKEKWNFSEAKVQAYSASEKSSRDYQEDRVLVDVNFQFSHQEENYQGKIFAVFDGHGGSGVSQYLQDNFSALLAEALSSEEDINDTSIYNAITSVFVNVHYRMKQTDDISGSTACVAVFLNGCIYTANTGDSRMVMGIDKEVYQITKDDKLDNPKLLREIYQRGARIQNRRLDGSLAMAKAIGDQKVSGINPCPIIHKIDPKKLPQPERACLIIGSDGLWDVMDKHDARKIAIECKDVKESAKDLCDRALSNKSSDNISAIVVYLTPNAQASAVSNAQELNSEAEKQ